MHKSSASSKTSHHGSRTPSIEANLPFSIDQILSSSSSPMKQAAAVHHAMSVAAASAAAATAVASGTFDHQIFQRQQQQLRHQQNLHHTSQQHQQQQQQAAAVLMLNQATSGGVHQTTAGDNTSSTAMLNEQLALLVAAQQQQQQQQQQKQQQQPQQQQLGQKHIAKSNALAAQQHLHQQWQHQQLMAAAAAALSQTGANLSTLGALGPALSSLASQQQQQNSPNHLLSCFMASMLLQQQQQQVQQKQIEQHQQRRTTAASAAGNCSSATPFENQPRDQQARLAAHLNAVATAAVAHHRSPPSSTTTNSNPVSNDTDRPIKRFFSGRSLEDCPASQPATNNISLHQSVNNKHLPPPPPRPHKRDSISPQHPIGDHHACAPHGQSHQSQTSKSSKSQGRVSGDFSPRAAHSYIGLIAMCILSTPEKRMVLNDIYQFILDHYPYYRNRGSGWRNSVRHNLSLNECFQKDIRAPNGKGHYWRIHPANMADFMNGDFRRRRAQRQVRRYNNMEVPSDESDDESMVDTTRPPLPEHFKRSLEMHKQLDIIYGSGKLSGNGSSGDSINHQVRIAECLAQPHPSSHGSNFMSVAAMAAMATQGRTPLALPPPPPPPTFSASANLSEQNISSDSKETLTPTSPHGEESILFGR